MTADIRVATFNLENLDWSAARDEQFKRRVAALKPILHDLRPDILCLQEIGAQKATAHAQRSFIALDRLLAGGPFEAYSRATSTRPGSVLPADVHNLAILSRWPICEQRQIHHDIVPKLRWTPLHLSGAESGSLEITFDRPLLYVRVCPPGAPPLHLINLHLRAPRPVPLPSLGPSSRAFAEGQFLAAQKSNGQALEARLFAESLFNCEPGARIAICGDFNADEHEAPMRILLGDHRDDARLLRQLEARLPPERRYSVIHAGRPTLIDHILASRSLALDCIHVEILNQGLQDEVFASEPIEGSLHAPVVASFRTACFGAATD
jgi:endonuclease/exonuclease/phosphatase family metal-dependent hydrolase